MFKLSIRPQWQLENPAGRQLLPKLVELLARVHETGTLAEACIQAGLSYRYAWGLLKQGEQTFATPLVTMVRGRGAVLTPLAEKLVWADRRISARLSPLLDSLASELEVELERALSHAGAILRIHASHGFAVETLRESFVRQQMPIDLQYRSSFEALAALHSGGCDMAGFHVPLGEFQAEALQRYAHLLDSASQRLIHLATRRQGIMLAPGNPKKIAELADLTRADVRFVNRQTGSGTRMLVDLMLAKAAIDRDRIQGYDSAEFTHAAVAAYVASGMADAGIGVETAAKRFSLGFVPLVTERYFFACNRSFVDTPLAGRVVAILRSAEFRNLVNALPGYDAAATGEVTAIGQTFASLRSSPASEG